MKQLMAGLGLILLAIILVTIDDYMFSNPMEVIANKSDFLISLCEIIVGGRYGLSAEERSVIDKCVQRIYKHFIENEPSEDKMPLLSDLQRELHEEGEVALRVANSLEMLSSPKELSTIPRKCSSSPLLQRTVMCFMC